MKKILVIGSSNTDMVIKTHRFPSPGETILGGDFFMFPGGKGANQAVAAARMGGDVTLLCKVGNDVFGKQAIEGFQAEGIRIDYISPDLEKASGVALILVSASGENEIVVAPGANNSLLEADIRTIEDSVKEIDVLLMQLEIPLDSVRLAALHAFKSGKKVILNPAPAKFLPADIYPNLYLITPNETEAEILTGIAVEGISTAEFAADILLERGVKNVIITLGSNGAYFKNQETSFSVPAPKVEAVDTTAAGDVFNGALSVFLASGKDWKSCIALACKAAAISVTRMGAQASAPYKHEMNANGQVPNQ